MPLPVKVTKDLRVLVERDVPLSGGEALELGKRLLEKGAIAVALEAVGDRPQRGRAKQEVGDAA